MMLRDHKNDEWRELAYHEAGHAVCAIAERKALGLPDDMLQELYLVRPKDRIKTKSSLGGILECEAEEGGRFTRRSVVKALKLKCNCDACNNTLDHMDKTKLKGVLEWHANVSMGGPAATGIVKGYENNTKALADGGSGDMVEVVNALRTICEFNGINRENVDVDRVFQAAYERTMRFLRGQWKCVEAIGNAAMQAERLSGHVIEAIARPLWRPEIMHEPLVLIPEKKGWWR